MTTLWSRDREIQEIARKVPDPLSRKAESAVLRAIISKKYADMAYAMTFDHRNCTHYIYVPTYYCKSQFTSPECGFAR